MKETESTKKADKQSSSTFKIDVSYTDDQITKADGAASILLSALKGNDSNEKVQQLVQ